MLAQGKPHTKYQIQTPYKMPNTEQIPDPKPIKKIPYKTQVGECGGAEGAEEEEEEGEDASSI